MNHEVEELISLLEEEFKPIDGFKGWDRTIQRITKSDNNNIILEVYRSNQSSIHYHYTIDMNVCIDKNKILINIKTNTSTVNGDPYCQRGFINNPNEIILTKNKNEFKNNNEIVSYVDTTFWKYYFKIESRN